MTETFTKYKLVQDIQGRHVVLEETESSGEVKQIAIFLKPYKSMAKWYVEELNRDLP